MRVFMHGSTCANLTNFFRFSLQGGGVGRVVLIVDRKV